MKDAKKELLFSELLSLLASGLDFSRSFSLLIAGESDAKSRIQLQTLYDRVAAGSSLAQAMKTDFAPLDQGVVRIGEETGRLAEALKFLADYYHKKVAQRRMISGALSYPLVIMAMAIIVVIFMLAVVVPMFEQVYSRMGSELPRMTRMIISLSAKFPIYAAVGGTLIVGIAAIIYAAREKDEVRNALSITILRMPLINETVKKSCQAQFCKLLYLLTASGIPLLKGIDMLKEIVTFYPYQKSLDGIENGLKKGELFSQNLEKYPALYSRKLAALLRVGEETSRLPEMLLKQSDDLTRALEHRLKQLGAVLEPLMILLIGVLVAIILISMYLPMFKLGETMG